MSEPSIPSGKANDPVPAICPRFDAPDADIVIQSSDNVLFKVYRKNLNAYSEAFPGEGLPVNEEVVQLPEDSTVLELLFQYMSLQPQPAIEDLSFETLAKLSEATEKYQVYSAMKICNVFMAQAMPQHPMAVLAYASRHEYRSIADMAAPLTLDATLSEATAALGSTHVICWILYREAWIDIRRVKPPKVAANHSPLCSVWKAVYMTWASEVFSSFSASTDIDRVLSAIACPCTVCKTRLLGWGRLLKEAGEKVAKFSTIKPVF